MDSGLDAQVIFHVDVMIKIVSDEKYLQRNEVYLVSGLITNYISVWGISQKKTS